MLNPAGITDAIVTALKTITDLATAMTVLDANQDPVVRIVAFHYLLGQEQRLAEAIYGMPAPSMLVAWEGTKGGNFDGQTIWKHRFGIYYRMGNAAGAATPVGYEDLWALTCNGATGTPDKTGAVTGPNIRNIQIAAGLDIMDTPSIDHALDEDLIDRFKAVLIIPEIGDN
jgi:hypothetical protein